MDKPLRERVRALMQEKVLTLTTLVQETSWSKGALSGWLNGHYQGDVQTLEAAVAEAIKKYEAPDLTFTDSIRLTNILSILDSADDRHAIHAALTRFGPANARS